MNLMTSLRDAVISMTGTVRIGKLWDLLHCNADRHYFVSRIVPCLDVFVSGCVIKCCIDVFGQSPGVGAVEQWGQGGGLGVIVVDRAFHRGLDSYFIFRSEFQLWLRQWCSGTGVILSCAVGCLGAEGGTQGCSFPHKLHGM